MRLALSKKLKYGSMKWNPNCQEHSDDLESFEKLLAIKTFPTELYDKSPSL